jgi:hypothetical protein
MGLDQKTLRRSRDDQREAREDEKQVTEEKYREDLKGLSEEKHQSFISYMTSLFKKP